MGSLAAGVTRAAAAGLAAAALAVTTVVAVPAPSSAQLLSGGPTDWLALNAAIARIPTYDGSSVSWVVSTRYSFWGTADWYNAVLYVNPDVPRDRLYDVVVHEWSHELSVRDYDGDVRRAKRAMNRFFGGDHLVGAERAADCMAILQGAVWTHYTQCRDRHWRHGARRLVNGRRLR